MRNHATSRLTRLFPAATLAALLLGCGGGGGDAAPPPPAGNVGPSGGTVTSADNNASLEVPPGALSSTISVALTPATDGFMADPQIVPGTVYRLDAPDSALAQPATLSVTLPANAFGASEGARRHAQAVIQAPGFLGCYSRTFALGSGYSFFPIPLSPGTDLPPAPDPNAADQTVCVYDNAFGCPGGFLEGESGIWHLPDYFTPQNPGTFPPGSDSGDGRVLVCQVAPVAQPVLVRLSPSAMAAILPSRFDNITNRVSTILPSIQPGLFASLFDRTPPVLSAQPLVSVVAPGMAQLHITFTATDNVGVSQVSFATGDLALDPITHAVTSVIAPLAQFSAPPYVWDSPAMPFDQLFNHYYVMSASDASGNKTTKAFSLQQSTPNITGFSASPASVPFGGGDVTLSWTIPFGTANAFVYPDSISIDNGIGDVTGLTSKTVHVTAPTTFVLTATNTATSVPATRTLQTSVTVGVEPAPTITAFTATPATLPAGGGSVHLAWATTNGDTLGIDHGIGTVSGPVGSADVNVTSSTDFTLTATNPDGFATKQASVVVATTGDRFVDVAAGADTNDCSQVAPCKTIAKAMNGAPSGSTVYLADGVYGTATQGNGATIPDGVALKATNAGAAVLTLVTLNVAGSATISGIVLDQQNGTCASVTANSATGTPTLALTGVLIKCMGALNLGGNVKATMTPGALAGGVYTEALPGGYGGILGLAGAAELLIQGGVIDGNNLGGVAYGAGLMSAVGQSKLTLNGVTVRNRAETVIIAAGNAAVVLINGTVLDTVSGGGCATGAAIVIGGTNSVTLDHAQISNAPAGGAICVRNSLSVATISVSQSTIMHTAAAIASEVGTGSVAVVTLDGASFTNNGYGIRWDGLAGSSFDVKNSTLTGNGIGVQFNGNAGALKLRTSNVSNNTDAGVALFAMVSADLGTQGDPGGNTFTGNTNVGLKNNLQSGTLQAVGNTWIANQQGADGNGHYSTAPSYTPVPKLGPASGKNYNIAAAVTLDL